MEVVTYSVTDVFFDGRKSVSNRVRVDRVTDVAKSVADLEFLDSLKKALSCYVNKFLRLRAGFANRNSSCGVAVITLVKRSNVDLYDVAL